MPDDATSQPQPSPEEQALQAMMERTMAAALNVALPLVEKRLVDQVDARLSDLAQRIPQMAEITARIEAASRHGAEQLQNVTNHFDARIKALQGGPIPPSQAGQPASQPPSPDGQASPPKTRGGNLIALMDTGFDIVKEVLPMITELAKTWQATKSGGQLSDPAYLAKLRMENPMLAGFVAQQLGYTATDLQLPAIIQQTALAAGQAGVRAGVGMRVTALQEAGAWPSAMPSPATSGGFPGSPSAASPAPSGPQPPRPGISMSSRRRQPQRQQQPQPRPSPQSNKGPLVIEGSLTDSDVAIAPARPRLADLFEQA